MGYDPQKETYSNVKEPAPVDIGSGVAYGQLSHSEPKGDKRVLHVSWLVLKAPAGGWGDACNGGGVMTSLRDLRYDPRIERLVESPIAEYKKLRSNLVFQV